MGDNLNNRHSVLVLGFLALTMTMLVFQNCGKAPSSQFDSASSKMMTQPDFVAKQFIVRMKNGESVIYLAMDDNNEAMGFVQLYPSFTSVGMNKMWILNDLWCTGSNG